MELIYKLINTSLSGLRFDVMILAITQNNGAVFAIFLVIWISQVFSFKKIDFTAIEHDGSVLRTSTERSIESYNQHFFDRY